MLAAVENRFPAPHVLGHGVESGEHMKAQPLSLVLLGDADFFNVADRRAVLYAGFKPNCQKQQRNMYM